MVFRNYPFPALLAREIYVCAFPLSVIVIEVFEWLGLLDFHLARQMHKFVGWALQQC